MKRRRAGLYRRQYGIFCFRYKDKNGRRREKSTGTTDRAAALSFKRMWDQDNANDQLPNDKGNWTVAQATTCWVQQHTARLTSSKARSNERSYLRQLISGLGPKRLNTISIDDLKNYQGTRSGQVAACTVNMELRILVAVLKEANLWKRTLSDHYKRLKETESEIGCALTIQQLKRLEATAAKNDAWEVAYAAEIIASNAGLRGGEIKKLRLGAIDLENRRIQIKRKSTKSNAGARLVELNQAALAAVVKLCRRAELLGATDPEHYLLPADLSKHTKGFDPLTGGPGYDVTQHQRSWDTAWKNLRKAAGLGKVRFHDMRHTFISMMGERGVPLQVVQAMVGHMSPAMVKHYTHISSGVTRAAVEMLDKIHQAPPFVDVFVDVRQEPKAKLLN
jgi:integrase